MRKFLSLFVVLLTTFTSAWADDANLLPGRFSVSATKQVQFTKGNLYYSTTDSKYHLEAAQNVTYVTLGQSAYDATHVCHFFWSNNTDWQTSDKEPWASTYAYSTQATTDKFFCGEENKINVDATEGLYALTKDEWSYLMGDNATRNGKYAKGVSVTIGEKTVANCLVIAPDNCLNSYTFDNSKTTYTAEEWATAEAAGLVCLPTAGYRNGSSFVSGGSEGGYWSATPIDYWGGLAYSLYFTDSSVVPAGNSMRSNGFYLRLVKTPYLCFTAEEDNSKVTFNWESGSDVKYSKDGTNWSDCPSGTEIPLANVGDKVYFKGTGVKTGLSKHFTMSGKIAASGDVTSLTNGTGGNATLSESCYSGMFSGCTSLTAAPELPAKTLLEYCYQNMFDGCTSLTVAPELPATALATSCYYMMFKDCTSLTTAPELKATPLAKACYMFMFLGCTKLSKVTVSFTDWNTSGYATAEWLNNAGTDASVTSRTFICPAGLDVTTTKDASHVPEGWYVVNKQVSTKDELTTAVSNAQTGEIIQLTDNIDLTAELGIAAGKDFTLDLNGHVLKQTAQASVIGNKGTLTIADNSAAKTGKITGGHPTNGGGGIYNEGTLNITGGTITGNTAGTYGGGILNHGLVTVGGTAVIEGNTLTGTTTKSDLDLGTGALTISTTTPLATGAKIGIAASTAGQFTTGTVTATDTQYFFADNADKYGIRYNTAGYLETFYKQVSTRTQLIAAVKNAQKDDVIKLAADIDLTAELSIADDKNFTLDLNGHVLKQTAEASVINNAGSLIIADNSAAKTGKITGGNTTLRGGGIYNTGTLNITGGTITGNTADKFGGGISNYGGTLNITGGTIKANKAKEGGAGVDNYNNGTVTVGGTAVIEGNTLTGGTTQNDLALNGTKLTISTATPLATGAKVGIAASGVYQFTTNGSADDAKYFFSDDDKYVLQYNSNHLELALPVTLDETATAYPEAGVWDENQIYNITLNRTLDASKWNTLMLPFPMTADEVTANFGTGAQLKKMTGVENYVVKFETATDMDICEAYIVQPAADVTKIEVKSKTGLKNSVYEEGKSLLLQDGYGHAYRHFNTWEATSSFNKEIYNASQMSDPMYVLSGNKFYLIKSDNVEVKGYRWIFGEVGPAPSAKQSLSISFDGDIVTGINEVNAYASTGSAQANGKYLKNGKLVIVKDGKTFNAAGQEIK